MLIVRDNNKTKVIIYAPFEFALDWCQKYTPFFIFDNEITEVISILGFNPFNNIHDKFSLYNDSYFYKYLVFEI